MYLLLLDEREVYHWGGWLGGFRDVAEPGRKPKLQTIMPSLCASMPEFAKTRNPEASYR